MLALIIIFLVPTIINASMYLMGDKYDFSSNSTFIKTNKSDRKSIMIDLDDYELDEPSVLDFSCTSSIVKTQFSCEILKR